MIATPFYAPAQARFRPRYQEPEWLTFYLSEISAGVYAEGTYESDTFEKSSTRVSHENYFVGPFISLSANGSVYHPNLVRYYINTEGALGWNEDRVVSTTTSSQGELQYLGHFSASISLLETKPYHGSLFVDYDHTYRENDFFTRVEVDNLRYGMRAMWEVGDFVFNADYLHRNEKSSSPYWGTETVSSTSIINGTPVVTFSTNQVRLTQKTVSDEDTATFAARHQRDAGGTAFNYNLNHYTRTEGNSVGNGTDHTLSLSENDHFGAHDNNRFNASASYYRRDTSQEVSDQVTAFANLSLEHTPNLSSSYDVNYDHFNSGSFRSDYYAGSASLSHQLFESLTTGLTLRGSDYDTSDAANVGYTRRFGATLAESYTKRLSEESQLRLKNAFTIEHTDEASVGTIKNEQHSFTEANPAPNSFILNQRNVMAPTVVITDSGKTQQYISGIDYEVIQFGNQTEIHRLSGSAMPDSVVVSYQSEPIPAGSYETYSEFAEVRLELWKNLLGVYARANLSLNNAPAELMVQEVTSYTVGADTMWRALHAGAEYEIYDSTESQYRAARVFQSIAWHPGQTSSLSLDATETWIDYLDSHRKEEDYRLVTRYHEVLTHRLSLGVDAGVSFRRGNGVDQLLAVFRPSIKYVIGRTTIDVGYDYEYDLYLHSQESQTHRFSLRCKRLF